METSWPKVLCSYLLLLFSCFFVSTVYLGTKGLVHSEEELLDQSVNHPLFNTEVGFQKWRVLLVLLELYSHTAWILMYQKFNLKSRETGVKSAQIIFHPASRGGGRPHHKFFWFSPCEVVEFEFSCHWPNNTN